MRVFSIFIYGFLNGFILIIGSGVLNFWLTSAGLPISTISVISLSSISYAIKFIWAPLFDIKKISIFHFSNVISWFILIGFMLVTSVFVISNIDPVQSIILFFIAAFLISFFSSSLEVLLGVLRNEIVSASIQGSFIGWYILGYRVGMLISNFGALYLSEFIGWGFIYKIYCVILSVLLFIVVILFAFYLEGESKRDSQIFESSNSLKVQKKTSIKYKTFVRFCYFIYSVVRSIGSNQLVFLSFALILIYKLPDNIINVVINYYFHIHIGYSAIDMVRIGKLCGIIGSIIGGFVSSHIMKRVKIIDALYYFAIIHGLSHIFLILNDLYGKNFLLYSLTVLFESITGGMSMGSYIAFIMALCRGKYKATQYAFFSSVLGFSRTFFPIFSGYIVLVVGWKLFFLLMSLITIPIVLLLKKITPYFKL